MSEKEIWEKVLEIAQEKLSAVSYSTFLKDTELYTIKDGEAIVLSSIPFNANWLNQQYAEIIQAILFDVVGYEVKPHFITTEELANYSNYETATPKETTKPSTETTEDNHVLGREQFNAHNTFDTFVIGPGNRFPHAASLAVAEAPAKAYNPLFIYGGVGLGKTHLMHAIGHHVLDNNPNAKVIYTSSEKFTNEFIKSIRDNEGEAFNELHQNNKQIVISSDRPPKEIAQLEDRLRSRFEWGLIVDITPPDYETRMAILQKKIEEEKLDIPPEALNYIANQIQSNIRELEGALTRLLAYSQLLGKPITTELTAEALKDIIQAPKSKKITIQDIQKIVGQYYNVRIEDFSAKKRTKSIAYPRQIAMYLSRELTDFSLPKIGEEFGGRDHTTVIHAHEKISKDLKEDPIFKQEVENLEKEIRNV